MTKTTFQLASQIGETLFSKKQTLAVAESCTGGALSSAITDVPGASNWFVGGAVVYVNAEKIRQLGVDPETLATKGAVSSDCAKEMAVGIKERTGADWAVATTGFAGPTGGTENEPVGTLYVAVCSADVLKIERFVFANTDRLRYKKKAVESALELLLNCLIEQEKDDGREK